MHLIDDDLELSQERNGPASFWREAGGESGEGGKVKSGCKLSGSWIGEEGRKDLAQWPEGCGSKGGLCSGDGHQIGLC